MIMHVTDKPSLTDVLLGRGVATNRHPGNENFRSIVSQYIVSRAVSLLSNHMTKSVDHLSRMNVLY